MLQSRDAASEVILHLRVSRPDVLVVRCGSFLQVGFGVRADAGGAETNVALF